MVAAFRKEGELLRKKSLDNQLNRGVICICFHARKQKRGKMTICTTAKVSQSIERLHNQPTRYELVAERGDIRILIAYSMRTGRHSLLTSVQKHGQKLIDFMGITDEHLLVFLKPAKLGAHVGPADNPWTIRFTGRTQREAVQSELPWIGDMAAQEVSK
jgi:hypothetical protein